MRKNILKIAYLALLMPTLHVMAQDDSTHAAGYGISNLASNPVIESSRIEINSGNKLIEMASCPATNIGSIKGSGMGQWNLPVSESGMGHWKLPETRSGSFAYASATTSRGFSSNRWSFLYWCIGGSWFLHKKTEPVVNQGGF